MTSDQKKTLYDYLSHNYRKVRAMNDLRSKYLKKGDILYIDFEKEPLVGGIVIIKIFNNEGYVDTYIGQKYEACVRFIDKRR